MRVIVTPGASFKQAPPTVRATFVLLCMAGILMLADAASSGLVIHLFSGLGWLPVAFLAAYVLYDAGLMILHAKTAGRLLAGIGSGGLLLHGFLLAGGMVAESAEMRWSTSLAVLLVSGLCLGLLFSKPTGAFFEEHRVEYAPPAVPGEDDYKRGS